MMLRALLRDRRGASSIEYAMIAALVAILLITAMTQMGTSVQQMFANLAPAFAGPPPP